MAQVLRGEVTLHQALMNTKKYYPSRFNNLKRDAIKFVRIKEIKTFEPDRHNAPLVKYVIVTRSRPLYGEYKRAYRKKGRSGSLNHHYDIILELPKLSLDVPFKLRVGSGLVPRVAPQNKIHSIYLKNIRTWSSDKKKKHRAKKHRYLSPADYNAQVYGINGDFFHRMSWVYYLTGNLYGRNYNLYPEPDDNPHAIVFLDKHTIKVIEILMQRGHLRRGV